MGSEREAVLVNIHLAAAVLLDQPHLEDVVDISVPGLPWEPEDGALHVVDDEQQAVHKQVKLGMPVGYALLAETLLHEGKPFLGVRWAELVQHQHPPLLLQQLLVGEAVLGEGDGGWLHSAQAWRPGNGWGIRGRRVGLRHVVEGKPGDDPLLLLPLCAGGHRWSSDFPAVRWSFCLWPDKAMPFLTVLPPGRGVQTRERHSSRPWDGVGQRPPITGLTCGMPPAERLNTGLMLSRLYKFCCLICNKEIKAFSATNHDFGVGWRRTPAPSGPRPLTTPLAINLLLTMVIIMSVINKSFIKVAI